jgi:hypothetical protein
MKKTILNLLLLPIIIPMFIVGWLLYCHGEKKRHVPNET